MNAEGMRDSRSLWRPRLALATSAMLLGQWRVCLEAG